MALVEARSIFNPATGYIARGGFDFTCNPYLGCTYGCKYCYAMFLPQNRRPKEDWGRWFDAKRNAVALAERAAHKLAGQALYLSSVTDPYQPAERSLFLTRGILEALLPHQPRLAIQTRSPLVLRDIDLLLQFHRLRVNLSIPTDSDDVWRAFEPKSPSLARRWEAAVELRAAGISVGICLTPLLPLDNETKFIDRIVDFRPDVLVLQDFHAARGFGADTAPAARQLLKESC
ncbi:MAG: SPL family radical SAM protein [Gemmataceae bacterium]